MLEPDLVGTGEVPIDQVDAFTDHVCGGNPAAVCILMNWLESRVQQDVAAENYLSETVFNRLREIFFDMCWFTPEVITVNPRRLR
jgi:predicted PhzF superfamily epimerase YddE/YHI9